MTRITSVLPKVRHHPVAVSMQDPKIPQDLADHLLGKPAIGADPCRHDHHEHRAAPMSITFHVPIPPVAVDLLVSARLGAPVSREARAL